MKPVEYSATRRRRRSVLVARPRPGTRRVLCGVDFSDGSWAAARAAVTLHHAVGDELTFVHARASNESAAEAMRRLEAVVVELGRGTAKLVEGTADVVIPALAFDKRADLVVLGTSGRTGLRGQPLGSIARAVARDAPCSVLIVRNA